MDRADLILKNGRVITMAPASPRAEMVAVAGGRIIAVGTADDAESLTGPGTRVIDLAGRTLMPGFVELDT